MLSSCFSEMERPLNQADHIWGSGSLADAPPHDVPHINGQQTTFAPVEQSQGLGLWLLKHTTH